MLQPDEQITVTLTAVEWNQVMAQLAEGPYRIVAPLLAKIQQQAMAHDGVRPAGPADEMKGSAHVPH